MKSSLLNSKLARKVFLFFIVSSFFPLLLGVLFSHYYVKNVVQKNIEYTLSESSKTYSTMLFSRLTQAKKALKNHYYLLSLGVDANKNDKISTYFSLITIGSPKSKHTILSSENYLSVAGKMVFEKASIEYIDNNDGGKDTYIVFSDSIYAKFNPNFLWGAEEQSYGFNSCVFNSKYELIFCDIPFSSDDLSKVKDTMVNASYRNFSALVSDTAFMFSYRPLFIKYEFNEADWYILSGYPKKLSNDTIVKYEKFFLPLVIFSFLLALLLSSVVVRKNLGVVRRLIDGARRISNNDFSSEIDISSNDEFFDLANSFNTMSKEIKSIINEYKSFSLLDESILNSRSPEHTIETMFHSLESIVCANDFILINNVVEMPFLKQFYFKGSKSNLIHSSSDDSFSFSDFCGLYDGSFEFNEITDPRLSGVRERFSIEGSSVYFIPIAYAEKCSAVILIAFDGSGSNAFEKAKIASFSSRLSTVFQSLYKQEALVYQANYDFLTDIPNRHHVVSVYESQVEMLADPDHAFAFVYLDLDRFKHVNDNYGHVVGDRLLSQFVGRVKEVIGPNDVLARMGGDEFVVITGTKEVCFLTDYADDLCRKIGLCAKQPFDIDKHSLVVGSSIGVFLVRNKEGFEHSFTSADIAMYFAKKEGGDCVAFYKPEMREVLLRRERLEKDLSMAINERSIDMHFQPKVDAKSHKLIGFEALFRWSHQLYGNVSPVEAVPIAEESGLIHKLGDLVFQKSLEQLQYWLSQGYNPGLIAVNVSPSQLLEPDFAQSIATMTSQFSLVEPSMVELEITESVMLTDKGSTLSTLQTLRSLGFNIAIDDFGTGYSSLEYLLDMPANVLKIDRAFVIKIEQDDNASEFLANLIELGKNMGYTIVVEGVETKHQANFLASCNADQLQGYFFSKPLPADLAEKRFLIQ